MTRIVTCGWETGDVNEIGTQTTGIFSDASVATTAPIPRSPGTYCLKITAPSNNFNPTYKNIVLPGNPAELWVRFGFYYSNASITGSTAVFRFADSAPNWQLSYDITHVDNLFNLYMGGSATYLATATSACARDVWHTIELYNKITNSTDGISRMWLDGNLVIDFAGDNSVSGPLNFGRFYIGPLNGSSMNGYLAYDDLAINNTASGTPNNAQIGDGRVLMLKPSGAGFITGQTRGGTDTGANWSQVNEIPFSMAQYVATPVPGTSDLYALDNMPAGSWLVNTVETFMMGAINDVTGGSLAPLLRSGGNTYEGPAIPMAIGAQTVKRLWELDPNGNVGWTPAAIDALQGGTMAR